MLASLGGKGKNRNCLACLRNAGSYSALTYCTAETLMFEREVHDQGPLVCTLSLSAKGWGKYATSSMSPRCLRLGPTPVTRVCVRTVFPKDRNKAATCATAQSCDFAAPP